MYSKAARLLSEAKAIINSAPSPEEIREADAKVREAKTIMATDKLLATGKAIRLSDAVKAAGYDRVTKPLVVVPASAAFRLKASDVTESPVGLDRLEPLVSPMAADRRWVYPVLPSRGVAYGVTSVQALKETARTLATTANMIRAIDAFNSEAQHHGNADPLARGTEADRALDR